MTVSRSLPGLLLAMLLGLPCTAACAPDRIRVVDEGGIRDEWTLPPGYELVLPGYPAQYADRQAEACVAIGYLVNPDGSTSGFALLKSWAAADVPGRPGQDYWAAFAQSSAQALSQWRFQPRAEVKVPRPVYTVATFLFAAKSAQLRGRCAIPDLAAHLRELRQDPGSRRKMDATLFDQLELDPLRVQREQALRPRMNQSGGMGN